MTERLIVIGGGGAGTAAATIARRLNPAMKVTLFTEFPDIAYSPCGIPFVHGREIDKFESLFLSTVERYVEDGLDMRMETTVTDIDLDRGTVTARNTHEGFDKLVVCTGFVWEKPDVPGANLPGLHYVKDIRAAMEFDKQLDDMKRVAVIGAGPLGVEMAGNLGHRGLQVDFIDEGAWVLSEVLDPDVAEPVHESLEKRGVTLRLGTRVEGFVGEDRVRAVATSAGEFECDAAIVCLHKQPAAHLGEAAGLELGTTGGIKVDERMQTSKPNVWAAGDVVEVPHGLSMIPIRGPHGLARLRAGPHRRVQRRRPRPRLRPRVGAVGDGRRRLHDRRLLARRDARDRDGRPVRAGQGRRREPRALLPGRDAHAREAARRARLAEDHRRPDPRRRGRQGALGLPRLRGQARRDARGPGVDGEHLLAADRRAVRADRDRRAERPGGAARRQGRPRTGHGLMASEFKRRLREQSEHYLLLDAAKRLGKDVPASPTA